MGILLCQLLLHVAVAPQPRLAALSVRCCLDNTPQTVLQVTHVHTFERAGCYFRRKHTSRPHIEEGHISLTPCIPFTIHQAPSLFLLSHHRTQLLAFISLPFAFFHTIPNVFTTATSLPDKDCDKKYSHPRMALLYRDKLKIQTQLAFHRIQCDFALTYYSPPEDIITLMAQDFIYSFLYLFFQEINFAPRTIFKPTA